MSQLQVTGEAKIRDIQGPVVANSGVITALDGDASQYVRGDGTLADFPTSTGGGSSVSYYLNSSVSQGTIGGVAYRQLSKTPISGAGTDIAISSNGYVASYITDANDPALLEVPAGNFNCEFYFSVNNNTGNPFVYAEVYKYDGTTFTLLGTSVGVPEYITEGTVINPYYFAVPVATSVLTVTDRIAIRIYVNVGGRTVTLHTENNHLCQVVTTFSKGLISLNNLTRQNQFFATGTSGTDFGISSATATHTFNLPVASAANTGKLSSTDWSTFNNKQNTITNPITGTGASTQIAYFNSGTSITSEAAFNYDASLNRLGVNTSVPNATIGANAALDSGYSLLLKSDNANYNGIGFGTDSTYGNLIATEKLGTALARNLTLLNQSGYISLTEAGNLGVNILNPNNGIDIYNSTNSFLWLHNAASGITGTDGVRLALFSTRSANLRNFDGAFSITAEGDFSVITLGTENIRVNSANGFVGIGSPASISSMLTVNGAVTGNSFIPTSSTIPTNGMYLSGTNTLGFATNGTLDMVLNEAGSLGIGTTSLTGFTLRLDKNITGSANPQAFAAGGTIQTDATGVVVLIGTSLQTVASANSSNVYHYNTGTGSIGAGTVIGNLYGYVASGLTQGTNNFGFYGNIAAAANRYNLYMNGTANNFMAGSLGIGATNLTGVNLFLSKTLTGGIDSYHINVNGIIQSDVTSSATYFRSSVSTAAATFTLGTINHYLANQGGLGAGSSVTNQYGFAVNSNLIGATNNFGFWGNIPSGTNRWNLYMAGTAANYLAGKLLIGSTTDNGAAFQVTGTATISSTLTASSLIRSGGTSSQYLMADGSVSTLSGLITGSGTSGQVAYFNGSNSITSEGGFIYDASTNRLGVNTSVPNATIGADSALDSGYGLLIKTGASNYNGIGIAIDSTYGNLISTEKLGTAVARNLTLLNQSGFVSLKENGNFGVNTLNPSVSGTGIDIYGSTSTSLRLHTATSGTTVTDGAGINFSAANNLGITNYEAGAIDIVTNGNSGVYIASNGFVGINGATPSVALTVTGAITQTSVTSSLLKTNSGGLLVAAVAGTDYVAPSGLSGYLPLSGGTMTGAITLVNGATGINVGDDATISDGNIANTMFVAGLQNIDRGYINFSSTSGNALGATNGGNLTWRGNNVGTVTSVAALTLGTSGTDLSSSVATGTTTPVITLNVPTASATNRGALSSADWTTFNNKASTASLANYLPLTGGTLTGALGGTSASFSSTLTAGDTTIINVAPILAIQSNTTGNIFLRFRQSADTMASMFYTNATATFTMSNNMGGLRFNTSGTSDAMNIIANGNVGIGTSSPAVNLDIAAANQILDSAGNVRIITTDSAAINKGGQFTMGGFYSGTSLSTVFGAISARKENSTDGNFLGYMAFATQNGSLQERMRITSGGVVQIGGTASTIWSSSSASISQVDINTTFPFVVAKNDQILAIFNRTNSNGVIIEFKYNGSVVGSISTNSNSLPSDLNFKKDITNMSLGLDLVTKLRPVHYRHKMDNDDEALSNGIIAQELEQALLDCGVEKNSLLMLQHKPNEKENESQYWVDYTKMIPILIKSIQEQQAQIEELKAKIK